MEKARSLTEDYKRIVAYCLAGNYLQAIIEEGDIEKCSKIIKTVYSKNMNSIELLALIDSLVEIEESDMLIDLINKIETFEEIVKTKFFCSIFKSKNTVIIEALKNKYNKNYSSLLDEEINEIIVVRNNKIIIPLDLLDAYVERNHWPYVDSMEAVDEALPKYFSRQKLIALLADKRDGARSFAYRKLSQDNTPGLSEVFVKGLSDPVRIVATESHKYLSKNIKVLPEEMLLIIDNIETYRKNTQRAVVQLLKKLKTQESGRVLIDLFFKDPATSLNGQVFMSLIPSIKNHSKVEGIPEEFLKELCKKKYFYTNDYFFSKELWEAVRHMQPTNLNELLPAYLTSLGGSTYSRVMADTKISDHVREILDLPK